ncbi:MAG: SoxY-related AACIE arm protein [Burkholderiales bacterium]|nr:SoxY-related AACIE arm protein [Burkholderiales bacterium]
MTPQSSRRRLLQATASAAAITLLPIRTVQATPELLAAALRETFGDTEIRRGRVKLDIALIAEDGTIVPTTITVDSPMTETDHVKEIHLFAERNPLPRVAAFHLGPHNGRAQVSTRIRLAEAQRVIAVARMNDGTLWSDEMQVEVSLTACGG